MAETAEKTADSAPKEKPLPAEAAHAPAAPVVEEEDFFEDFPLEEDAEAQEGMKKEQEELPLWAADWDDSETTDFAARLKEELKRSQPAGGGGK